jgi:solute carrier family 13 (sodium-dependent dicarboxylate transporter), member 2/3/5
MSAVDRAPSLVTWGGLVLGPVAAVALYGLLPRAGVDGVGGLSESARIVAGLGALMAIWWMTEAVAIEATSLLPLVVLPVSGVMTFKQTASPFASEQVFFFMGGFMLGRAMERWGLHRRVALHILRRVGTSPTRLVLGLMASTAGISLFVNNTATTLVILPIGLSLADAIEREHGVGSRLARNFGACAVLGIAYAASLGGMGTLVGTAPNIQLVGFFKDRVGVELSFARWLWIGLPIAAILTPMTWVMLTRVIFPIGNRAGGRVGGQDQNAARSKIDSELAHLGRMSTGEWITLVVFLAAATGWVFREPVCHMLGLVRQEGGRSVALVSDAWIGITAALLLFLIPVSLSRREFALDWRSASGLPWGVLLLFGGGLSLAEAMTSTGVDLAIGGQLAGLGGLPIWLMTLIVAGVVAGASELASNTALTAAMLPVMLGVEKQLGLSSGTLLIPATLAASCGFMLPVATPPNAIAFATGRVELRWMLRAGLALDVLGVIVITGVFMLLGGLVIG